MAKGILPAIRDWFFGSKAKGSSPRLRATYDIAQTGHDNANQWAGATGQDADAANSPGVRQLARNRSRHETQNNPTLTGIVRTITHYEIGTGPTLHVESDDEAYAEEVEQRWREWCNAVMLTSKLRQMVYGRVVDGESFARIGENPNLANAVKLDFQPFECDRCYTLWLPYLTPYRIDGVWFDTWGNPTFYDILQYHPGGVFPMPTWKFDTTPAQFILHLFNPERANQHRGIPEMLSSTDLWADRRRHRKATVAAAESAANVAAFLTTNQPAMDGEDAPSGRMEMPRNSLVVAPDGYDMKQIDAKHPNQTYESFSLSTLSEAARPMSMGKNVAACDSSSYNFAGGRLDIITSWKAVEVNQHNNTQRVVDRLFRAWYIDARLVYGWEAKDGGAIPSHQFFWVGMPYSDPEAEQNADEAAVKTGLKGIQEIYARRGKDWKVQQKLNARALGMTVPEYLKFMISNLETGKGGDQGSGQQEAPAKENDTPEQVKAKFKAMFPALAARMNGHLRANEPDKNNGGKFGKGDGSGGESGGKNSEHRKFLEGSPVVSIRGDEVPNFGKGHVGQLVAWVGAWFKKEHDNKANNPELGEVRMDENCASESVGHGTGPLKSSAFIAVPDIIEKGHVFPVGKGGKTGLMDTYVIAAPIHIGGKPYVGAAMVRRDSNSQSFYVHEVRAIENSKSAVQSTVLLPKQVSGPGGKLGAIDIVLQDIFSVKANA